MPDVTQVDRQIQSRVKAMREKDTLPPPRRASAFSGRSAAGSRRARARAAGRDPERDVRAGAARPRHAFAGGHAADRRPPPPGSVQSGPRRLRRSAPVSRRASPFARATFGATGGASAPPRKTRIRKTSRAARSAATIVRPRSLNPPALPSFGTALAQRVRFAGGEVPLWSLVTPLVLLVALGAAFAAAAVTSAADPSGGFAFAQSRAPSLQPRWLSALPAPTPRRPRRAPATPQNSEEKPKPLTLLERAAQGDEAAVKELSAKPVADLNVEEAISLSLGQSAQDVRAARALRDRVDHDPGLIKDAEVLSELRRYTDDPETARDALAAMANVPGPISPDLIYEVWTATASRTTATDLARSLIVMKCGQGVAGTRRGVRSARRGNLRAESPSVAARLDRR